MTHSQLLLFSLPLTPVITGLHASPVHLLPLLDAIPMAVVLLTPDRRVVAMNRAAEALTGYTWREVRGVPCMYVLRGDYCLENCPLRAKGDECGHGSLEGDVLTRDRRKVPVRATFASILDASGRLAGFIECLEDLSLIRELSARHDETLGFARIIGESPAMAHIFQILPGIAQTEAPVLITGETGTGKDMLAEAIHRASLRSKGPFVKVNCGALPEALLESELFGRHQDALTGAPESRPGRLRMAQGGTLFLAEVGDLPLSLQVKLLAFLDERIIHPLGSTSGMQVDARIIAATHLDLDQLAAQGRFRKDLLSRLTAVRLSLPPLRERGNDVRLLLDHFLRSIAARAGKFYTGFNEEALAILEAFNYPGNVRELRNIVEYAVSVCQEERIGRAHLPTYVTDSPGLADGFAGIPSQAVARASLPPAQVTAHEVVDNAPAGVGPLVPPDAGERWPDVERKMILDALVRAGGRRSKAAEILGWGRSTLWRKMKACGMDD